MFKNRTVLRFRAILWQRAMKRMSTVIVAQWKQSSAKIRTYKRYRVGQGEGRWQTQSYLLFWCGLVISGHGAEKLMMFGMDTKLDFKRLFINRLELALHSLQLLKRALLHGCTFSYSNNKSTEAWFRGHRTFFIHIHCFMVQEITLHCLYSLKIIPCTRVPAIEFNNNKTQRSMHT